jgi:hypothetical protein
VLVDHISSEPPLSVVFAIPDHPWVDSADGADVRISMTCASTSERTGRLCQVTSERSDDEGTAEVALRCQELKQIHDDLDAAVFDAYGWPHDLTDEQILERLVALNAERAEEERRGIIRWLRPEFQNPAGAKTEQQTTMAGIEIEEKEAEAKPKAAIPWPKDLPSQIAAVRDLTTINPTETWTLDRTAKSFKGAKRTQVQSALDSLAALGLLVTFTNGNVREWRAGAG